MTDLQDSILDRLVGTRVGVDWPDGPLTIAADVVGGRKPVKFGQTDNDRGAKSEIARRLGYPVLLCEAIQGANRGLTAEDDRRSLALALFGTIPVGGPLPRMSAQEQNRVAARLAIRAASVCPHRDCLLPAALAGLLEAATIDKGRLVAVARTRCETAGGAVSERMHTGWLTPRSTPVERGMHAAAMALHGFRMGKSVHGWSSIRESARLAASERGLAEAVACCVEIARQCGLAV